jgi:hypothetical protein
MEHNVAVLSPDQFADLRSRLNRDVAVQTWTKAQINAAIQAVEDRMQLAATKTAISNDIEAVAPGVFDANTKQLIFAIWSLTYATRQGVI